MVTVYVPVSSVSISGSTADLKVGNTRQLYKTISPSNATNQNVTWSSSNTDIATVSSSGLVTGISSGPVTITVTTQDGNKTDTVNLQVYEYEVTAVSYTHLDVYKRQGQYGN